MNNQYAHPTDKLGTMISYTIRKVGESPLGKFFVDFVYEWGKATYGPNVAGGDTWVVVKGGV